MPTRKPDALELFSQVLHIANGTAKPAAAPPAQRPPMLDAFSQPLRVPLPGEQRLLRAAVEAQHAAEQQRAERTSQLDSYIRAQAKAEAERASSSNANRGL